MGKQLAVAAEQLFLRVKGAKIVKTKGVLKCTATVAQLKNFFQSDPLSRLIQELNDSMKPCARCSRETKKAYSFFPICNGKLVSGRNESGIIFTPRKEKTDACCYCGHVNTLKENQAIKRAQAKRSKEIRSAFKKAAR